MTDPLGPLLDLAGVSADLERARDAVDTALRERALRRVGGQVAAEVGLRSAVASAALEGHGYPREEVRAGLVTDPVVQGALRLAGALGGLVEVWITAPRQALARLHVLAARDLVDAEALGRPIADADRLDTLLYSVGSSNAPALLRAAVVHGELLAARPFAGPNGLVARAAARLVSMSAGLDAHGLLPVDVGHHTRELEYQGASGAFATGTRDGLRAWFRHYAAAVELAAAELVTVCGEASRTSA